MNFNIKREIEIKMLNSKFSRKHFSISTKAAFEYLVILISLCVFLFSIIMNDQKISMQLIALSTLFLSIYLAIKYKNNIGLFIIYALIAYFNYSIIMVDYIKIPVNSYFTSFANDPVSYLGLNILFLFTLLLVIFSPIDIKQTYFGKYSYIKEKYSNVFIMTFLISFILLYILIFQYKRPATLGVRGSPTPIYEYSIIFFIIGFHFVGNFKPSRAILSVLLVLFILQNFIFGGRIIGLELLVLYFLMFYSYKTKINNIIPLLIIGFIFMSLIGMQRASINLSYDKIKMVIENIKLKMGTLDTSYSAYFTSLTFLKVKDKISLNTQIELLKQFILSIFFGSKIENSSLPIYTRNFYVHYNGGLLPYYFYFYCGWIGVIISALFINLYTIIIKSKLSKNGGFINCLTVYFVSTTFRWYLYSPITILRGVLLLGIIYMLFDFIYKLKYDKKIDVNI
ncbi:O-antigen polymerase [Thermoanaerobacterium sp. R66]|uniref:O-antigen polymerase n=1 Tax=Thermoanaerobacterium sp. R66 TaxID=2742479 RepID=UPI00237FFEEF|nr:O-antigen polymerase [Thermoanaerobacterium sp. R66]MDE4541328.1 oligosaccharide repeat unit polymerase [Thermoanaerobacterium sp. R66]